MFVELEAKEQVAIYRVSATVTDLLWKNLLDKNKKQKKNKTTRDFDTPWFNTLMVFLTHSGGPAGFLILLVNRR